MCKLKKEKVSSVSSEPIRTRSTNQSVIRHVGVSWTAWEKTYEKTCFGFVSIAGNFGSSGSRAITVLSLPSGYGLST